MIAHDSQKLLQAARFARSLGERDRAAGYANQLLAMNGNADEIAEAREILAWAGDRTPAPAAGPARVTIVDFDMEFWSLVRLMVKAAFAAIPALIIVIFIATGVVIGLGAILKGIGLGS